MSSSADNSFFAESSGFRPFVPSQPVERQFNKTIGNDDVLLSDFTALEEQDRSGQIPKEKEFAVSQNLSGKIIISSENNFENDSSSKRDERMSDKWWKDPSKPKIEEVQKIDNSKVSEVRVLPPKEFLERMHQDAEETNRQDRALILPKTDRALSVDEKPKLTREILLKILSSFKLSKSSKLAKILADQNIRLHLENQVI